ncbi:protein PHYTOCHROME-DEPENDENT LATE-FLOWERING-like [Pistacia vera]|uniref:protein PHYTOCHROME-DEPENDENT LATE-FLOWERING-like n=1 Tax=Pistacia vera TaxID=55513 RepID=UPI001263A9B8|nr:protein PHYTOCHROME-DEPENDENT LATE-FLOWERING-like [Pistacia vera]
MGVSFKLGKVRKRYRQEVVDTVDGNGVWDIEPEVGFGEGNFTGKGEKSSDHANVPAKSGRHLVTEDMELSFSLNLFTDGCCIGEPSKFFNYVPEKLCPYSKETETIFTAIEYGLLPGDLFDKLPCKYSDGAILCEIQDYRNCLHRRGIASVDKSPVVHKVLLKMCMENVIKDICLMSNDSWSYEDLLTVESLIWKALQPDLHLNPEAHGDRLCIEPWTKKLDLGITWGRKKRKLADAPATNPISSQNNKGVPCSQPTVSSSVLNLQKDSGTLETTLQPSPLTMGSNHQMVDGFNLSAMVDLTPLDLSPVPMQCFSGHNILRKETTPSVLPEQGTFETQAIQRPIFRIPKQEPLDFSPQQPTWSQSEIMFAAGRLQKQNNTFSHWKPEAGIVPHERIHGRRSPSLSKNSGQQAVLEGIPKLRAGMPTTVKQEPVETSNFTGLDVRRIRDSCIGMDARSNRSNLLQLKQHPSPVFGTNIPPSNSSWNQITHDQNSEKDVAIQKRKALQNPRVTAGVSIAPVSSHQNEAVQREASISAKRKKNSCPKDVSNNIPISNNPNAISAIRLQFRNPKLPEASGVKGDLKRFLMISEITRRNGLNKKKCNVEETLQEKRSFSISKFGSEFSKVNGTEEILLSENFADTVVNLAKTRTLRFGHKSQIHEGNNISVIDSKACLKLFMLKRQNEGFVEASIICGQQEGTVIPLLTSFPCTGMEREGYCLVSKSMEPQLSSTEGCSRAQHPTVTGGVTQAGGAPEQLLPHSLTSQLSASMLPPMNDGALTSNFGQLPSKTLHTGDHLLHPGNVQSTQQPSGSNSSRLLPNISAQLNPVRQQWHQNKQNRSQSQLLHRQVQQQLIHKIKMEEDLGAVVAGLNIPDLGGGIQGLRNIGRGSLNNVMDVGGSYRVPMGGQLPWIGNVGQFNNIGSSVPSPPDIKPHFGGVSDNANAAAATATALAKRRAADHQGQTLMGGYQYLRNTDGISSQPPNVQDMAYLLTNQQFWQQPQHQQQQQQELRSVLQPTEVNSLVDEYMGLPQTQPHSMSSGSPLRQMNRNMMFAPESSELATRTHNGSMADSSGGTSRNLSSFSKDKGIYRPHRL